MKEEKYFRVMYMDYWSNWMTEKEFAESSIDMSTVRAVEERQIMTKEEALDLLHKLGY